MMLLSSVSLSVGAVGVKGEFTLAQGESAIFVLAYGNRRSTTLERYRTQEKLQLTSEILAEPRRGDALRRPVARAGGAIIPGVAPDDVPWHWGHCCRIRRRACRRPSAGHGTGTTATHGLRDTSFTVNIL